MLQHCCLSSFSSHSEVSFNVFVSKRINICGDQIVKMVLKCCPSKAHIFYLLFCFLRKGWLSIFHVFLHPQTNKFQNVAYHCPKWIASLNFTSTNCWFHAARPQILSASNSHQMKTWLTASLKHVMCKSDMGEWPGRNSLQRISWTSNWVFASLMATNRQESGKSESALCLPLI